MCEIAVWSVTAYYAARCCEEGTEEVKEQQISLTKWEVIKIMLDVVLSESDTVDEKLGRHSSNDLTIPFKLAFNTLLINKVMKKL